MHVQLEAIQRAIKLLQAASCKYAILAADGTKHGDLELAAPEPERKRAAPKFGRGTLQAYYAPLIQDIQAGTSTVIPFGPFGADATAKNALRSAICSACSARWGNKSYISHMNEVGIELLRID